MKELVRQFTILREKGKEIDLLFFNSLRERLDFYNSLKKPSIKQLKVKKNRRLIQKKSRKLNSK